jgi:hypothetical protein
MLPLAQSMYGSEANMWYFGMNDSVKAIHSQAGYQQRDPMASFLYCLGAHRFVEKIKESLGDSTSIVQFFIDDGNISTEFDTMVEAIQVVLREGGGIRVQIKDG